MNNLKENLMYIAYLDCVRKITFYKCFKRIRTQITLKKLRDELKMIFGGDVDDGIKQGITS